MQLAQRERTQRLAPYLLVRAAGLPFQVVDGLRAPATYERIEQVLRDEEWCLQHSQAICDALFEVIRQHSDAAALRNQLVALKRNLFNGKFPKDPRMIEEALGRLPAEEGALLGEWRDRQLRMRSALSAGEDGLAQEVRHASQHMQQAAQDELFRRALALSSQSIFSKARDYINTPVEQQDGRLRKIESSLGMYVTRAATKTSPFSTFALIGEGRWQDGRTEAVAMPRQAELETRVTINLTTLMRIVKALIGLPEVAHLVPVRFGVFEEKTGELRGYGGTDSFDYGRMLAIDEEEAILPSLPVYQTVLKCLRDFGGSLAFGQLVGEVAAQLGDARTAELAVKQLIEAHVLTLGWPLMEGKPDYLERLVGLTESLPGPTANQVHRSLKGLATLLGEYPRATAERRPDLLGRMHAQLETAYEALNLNTATLKSLQFFEEAAIRSAPAELPTSGWADAIEDLKLLVRLLPAFHQWRLGTHSIREVFKEHYGEGGHCDDLLDFFTIAEEALPYLSAPPGSGDKRWPVGQYGSNASDAVRAVRSGFGAMVREEARSGSTVIRLDRERVAALADELPDACRHPLESFAFHVQLLPNAKEMVVGEVLGGFGQMFSRYLYLLDPGTSGGLTDAIREELGRSTPPGAVLAEVPGVFGFNANCRPAIAPAAVAYPGVDGTHPSSAVLKLRDLYLVHDPQADRLQLMHRPSQQEVYLLDTSALSFYFNPPLWRFLVAMFGRGASSVPVLPLLESGVKPEERQQIRHYPRVCLGQLTLARETWLIPRDQIPFRQAGESPFQYMLRLERWRRSVGLPRQVFVRATLDPAGVFMRSVLTGNDGSEAAGEFRDLKRKPQYVDFSSPILLKVWEKHLEAVDDTLVIQEMLPGPEDLVALYDGTERVTEWVVEVSESEFERRGV